MALVNHAKKEINAKIVYFGPPGSGKSDSLQYIFSRIKPSLRGELKKIPAGGDTLLFFDFSPFDAPMRDGYRVRLHVYTLTGQVTNPATWKMTLKGADGIVIVLDASPERVSDARESISQLRDFLAAYGTGLHDISAVLQSNRFNREAPATGNDFLVSSTDLAGLSGFSSCTSTGEGLLETLTALSRMVLNRVAENDKARNDNIEATAISDSESLQQMQADASGEDISETGQAKAGKVQPLSVALESAGVGVEGTVIRIPLNIACGDRNLRLTVTVSVDMENGNLNGGV